MAMPADRPNFFVLLELDPDAPWDEALFERVLAQARGMWTSRVAGPQRLQRTIEAKRNLRLLRDINTVMRDPQQRRHEQAEARKLQEAMLTVRRKDLDERLTLLLSRGYLLDKEIEKIRENFAEVLASHPDLVRRLDRAEVRPADTEVPTLRLNTSLEDELRAHLAAVGEISIYEVLKRVDGSITNGSPRDRLLDAATRLYEQMHYIKDKRDPTVSARSRLSGIAKVVFESDDMRRRHDMSVKLEKLRTIVVQLEDALGVAAEVFAKQVEWYLGKARTAGVDDLDLAKRYLVEHFTGRKWTIQLPAPEVGEKIERLVQCPRCAELNDPQNMACDICGFLLREPCPNCGATEPRYGGGCRCGFPIAQRDLVADLIAQARTDLDQHNLRQAEVKIDRAARIWRLPADRHDPLAVKIQEVRASLDDTRREIQTVNATIEAHMAARRFIAAAQALRAAPPGLPRRDLLLTEAQAAEQQARGLYRRARQPDAPRSRRIELYTEALRVCSDLGAARTELQGIPPEPPRQLRATVTDPAAGVLLTWQASPDTDVSYVVVRGSAPRPPESAEDLPGQQRVARVTDTSWRDRGAGAGVPLRYAVFTERSGAFSTPAVADPVVIAFDAAVEYRAEDSCVVLTWSLPDHAVAAEVRREEIAGTAAPTVLKVTEQGQLVDPKVRNGVRYRYTVRTGYGDPAGGLIWSNGSSVDVTPTVRPAPPGPLTVTGSPPSHGFYQHKVQIRWPPADRGVVKVIRQPGIGSLRQGDERSEGELQRDGVVKTGTPPVSDIWIETLRLCSYVPVLVLNGMGYVGPARRYALVPELADLRGEFVGQNIRLGWTWPKECDEVLVGYASDHQPQDPTAAPEQIAVGRIGGDRTGGCDIPASSDRCVFVIVGTVVKQDGVSFVTSGVQLGIDRPATRIQYEVKKTRLRRELVLHPSGPVALPALVLRGRAGRPPETRDDGDEVLSVSPMELTGRHSFSLPRSTRPGLACRLFTMSDTDAASVLLEPQQPVVT